MQEDLKSIFKPLYAPICFLIRNYITLRRLGAEPLGVAAWTTTEARRPDGVVQSFALIVVHSR